MFCKRILILQQTDPRFAERNRELCGMVKLVSCQNTDVTVFVTNADVSTFGEWWILLCFGGEIFARRLSTFNNFAFTLPPQDLQNVSCLLVKKEDGIFEAARAQYGPQNLCGYLLRNAEGSLFQQTASPYEQFVASAQSCSNGVDVGQLKASADGRYKSVQDYSAAFERYYAAGGNSDYYQCVKSQIAKVFVQFPPYYPLIKRYQQSFFVRIDFPSSEKYFVLGVLQQQGVVKYICYGLPAEKDQIADSDFVFVDSTPTAFWMLFQDAVTGQITSLKQPV